MPKVLTLTELRNMKEEDLLKEINQQYRAVAALQLTVKSGKDKGSHLYKRGKKQLSRMLTVLSELRHKAPEASIPAPTS